MDHAHAIPDNPSSMGRVAVTVAVNAQTSPE
jgi:hypothetical protein